MPKRDIRWALSWANSVVISSYLISALKAGFPTAPFEFPGDARRIAVLRSPNKEVGILSIYDDGDEATVEISNFSHTHFNCYGSTLTEDEQAKQVSESVVEFIQALLADRVLLYRSIDGRYDGFKRLDLIDEEVSPKPGEQYSLWSRAYDPAARFRPTNK